MTQTHRGLEKAAEEKTLGLALHEPLEVTERSRSNVGGAMRMDTLAKFLNDLDNEEQIRAAMGINIGWRIRENPAVLKTAQKIWGKISGMSSADTNDYLIDCEDRFNKWLDHTKKSDIIHKRNMAIRICAEGYTYEETGFAYNLDYRSVKKYAKEAVEVYVVANRPERLPEINTATAPLVELAIIPLTYGIERSEESSHE